MKGCRLVRHDGSTTRATPTVNLALPAPHAPTPNTPHMLRGLSACHRTTPVDPQPLALAPQLTAYACLTPWQARITAGRRPAAAPAPVGALERVNLLRGLWAAPREEAIEVRAGLLSNPW